MRTTTLRVDQLRAAIQKTTKLLAGQNIAVTQIGSKAFCEWHPTTMEVKRINLPVIPDRPTELFLDALQGFVDHEVAHALYTNPHALKDMTTRDDVSDKVAAKSVHNCVEDVRIEREMASQFRGAEANLDATRRHIIETVWGPAIDRIAPAIEFDPRAAKQARGFAFVPWLRARAGQKSCAEFMEARGLNALFENVDTAIPDLEKRLRRMRSTKDAADVTALILKALEGDEPEDEDGEPGDSGEPDGTGEASVEKEKREPTEVDFDEVRDMDDILSKVIEGEMKGAFDSRTQTFLTHDYDVVEPLVVRGKTDVSAFEKKVQEIAGAMQKELMRIIVARQQSYNVPGFRSGRLNGPALHRLRVNDDRVFRRRHVADTHKVAVELVVDCSGSMSHKGKIRVAMEAAWAFADTLDRLKIVNEVVGFTTGYIPGDHYDDYRERLREMIAATGISSEKISKVPLYMPIFKSFEEKFGVEQKRRMASAATGGLSLADNNDALAIQTAAARLRRRTETRKIMIVFSDGMPCDGGIDYSTLNYSTKVAVQEAEKQGIEVIGVGILDASVRGFYPKHFVINNLAELPKFVMKELKTLLVPGRNKLAA